MERAATEKKIAILERALHHHPGSERLLLALLEAVSWIGSGFHIDIPLEDIYEDMSCIMRGQFLQGTCLTMPLPIH